MAKSTQDLGGIVVYIDTENATSVENLSLLGVDISKRFVYVDTHCTEEVLSIAESTIMKAKAMDKDVPITIIWDSVAATSPKAELTGDYDKETIGLQARAISKGMRKITGVIANQNVLMICLNQIRMKIGVMYGDPTCVNPETTKVKIRYNENSLFAEKLREYNTKTKKGD
jgi:recombination protein RecA